MLSAEDRAAIEDLHRSWLDAELRGDSSALLDFCTAAPVWLPPNQAPLCGRAAIVRWLGDQPRIEVVRIDIDHLAIAGTASFASKLASFRTTVQSPGEACASVTTGSHGWLLQRDAGGTWRISVVAWIIEGKAVE
jgi:ketosteroid isomerase-like protein